MTTTDQGQVIPIVCNYRFIRLTPVLILVRDHEIIYKNPPGGYKALVPFPCLAAPRYDAPSHQRHAGICCGRQRLWPPGDSGHDGWSVAAYGAILTLLLGRQPGEQPPSLQKRRTAPPECATRASRLSLSSVSHASLPCREQRTHVSWFSWSLAGGSHGGQQFQPRKHRTANRGAPR